MQMDMNKFLISQKHIFSFLVPIAGSLFKVCMLEEWHKIIELSNVYMYLQPQTTDTRWPNPSFFTAIIQTPIQNKYIFGIWI